MFKLSKHHNLNLLAVYKKAKHIYDDVPFVKKRKRQEQLLKFLKYFSIFVVVTAIISLIFFFSYFKDIRLFYDLAMSGRKNIEQSVNLILNEKYGSAASVAELANRDFDAAVKIAEKYSDKFAIRHITFFRDQLSDLKYLMLSAEIISNAVGQSAKFANALESILARKNKTFNSLSVEDKKALLEIIYTSSPELAGIKANIDLSLLNLTNIGFTGVLLPFKEKVEELETQLLKVQQNLEAIIPLSNFVPVVFGYPEKAGFLFILQNSDELRPTGGFIGTYGILETKYGDILRMETHDVYHLDMPVKDVFSKEPPAPLKEYLGIDKWYMRDANWSPDWPTSARQIEWFYHKEDELLPAVDQVNNYSEDFDGVIAITSKVVTDLLDILGAVYIEGQEFNSENFVDLLQYKVEQEYMQLGISSWHRKAIIGEIVKELKIKLFDLSPGELYTVFDNFRGNLIEKNILLYFNDPGYEELARERSWTGEIKQTDSDYLMVVDANMASYKTDAVMMRGYEYNLEKQVNNEIIANLSLNYSHQGGFDWKTTRYRTYTRVYAPKGSRLISIEGAANEKIDVYDELGKTVYGFFVSVEPGSIKNVKINYKLSKSVEASVHGNTYNLYIQKQPGNDIEDLTVKIDLQEKVDKFYPTGLFADNSRYGIVEWDTELTSDRQFFIKTK